MRKKKATLYVKSEKVVLGEISTTEPHLMKKGVARGDFRHMRHMFWDTAFDTVSKAKYGYVLPDDQKAIVETVEKLCEKHGFELSVIDVTKEDFLHRAKQEWINKIKTFPTLITEFGGRIEGSISKKQIESLLSRG